VGLFCLVTVSQGGHGTARLDQVRFGGLAASCGGQGRFWSSWVRRGVSRRSCFGALWCGKSGMLGLGTAV